MLSFGADFVSNFLANIIFWLAGGIIFGVLLSQRRRRLHRFFGIVKNQPTVVYLSSFVVEKDTVRDRKGNVRGHQGIGIVDYEFQTVPLIAIIDPKN